MNNNKKMMANISADNEWRNHVYHEFNVNDPTDILIFDTMMMAHTFALLIGIIPNASVIYITIVNKSLHSPCCYLLAIQCLGFVVRPYGNVVQLVNELTRTYIPLMTCFWVQLVTMFFFRVNRNTPFLIATDRFLNTAFPYWSEVSKKRYTVFILILLAVVSGVQEYYFSYVWSVLTRKGAKNGLICGPDILNRNNDTMWAFIWTELAIEALCYLCIWFLVAKHARNHTENLGERDPHHFTRNVFKSLLAIFLVQIFTKLIGLILLFVLSFLKIDDGPRWKIAHPVWILSAFISTLSTPLLLYFFSSLYREAFKRMFQQIRHCGKKTTSTVTPIFHSSQHLVHPPHPHQN